MRQTVLFVDYLLLGSLSFIFFWISTEFLLASKGNIPLKISFHWRDLQLVAVAGVHHSSVADMKEEEQVEWGFETSVISLNSFFFCSGPYPLSCVLQNDSQDSWGGVWRENPEFVAFADLFAVSYSPCGWFQAPTLGWRRVVYMGSEPVPANHCITPPKGGFSCNFWNNFFWFICWFCKIQN